MAKKPPLSESATLASIARLCLAVGSSRTLAEAKWRASRALELAQGLEKQVKSGIHRNPPLAIIGLNPPMGELRRIQYTHAEDGRLYEHEFKGGVQILPRKDGSVLLQHKGGKPIAKDFV